MTKVAVNLLGSVFFACSLGVSAVAAEPIMLSVKLVKAQAGRATAPPRLELTGDASSWRVTDKPHHNGENDREIFFEIETDAAPPPLAAVTLRAPGVTAARVLVGKTDVPFTREGDGVRFHLVDDRSRGQHMETLWHSPRGGYPIYFRHNWEMRRAGKYAEGTYPAKAIAAIKNYLLAAHEALRLMGDMGPDGAKAFKGEIVLMDTEIAATRGHLDWPAHVHIMHYQFAPDASGKQQWVSRLVPHHYLDDEGRIERAHFDVLHGRGKSGAFGKGDPLRLQDSDGTHLLDLVIAPEGMLLRRPDGVVWSLRPDPRDGASSAVWVYRADTAMARARINDDAARGELRLRIDSIADGKVVDTLTDGFRYDPFTGKGLGKLAAPAALRE